MVNACQATVDSRQNLSIRKERRLEAVVVVVDSLTHLSKQGEDCGMVLVAAALGHYHEKEPSGEGVTYFVVQTLEGY